MANVTLSQSRSSLRTLEQAWSACLAELQLQSATLLATSESDPAHRVYGLGERAYKIVLRHHESTSFRRAASLERERWLLRQCAGIPGIPPVLDAVEHADFSLTVLPWIRGAPVGTGRTRLWQHGKTAIQLVQILHRLSWRGVSHNDLKPQNVLRDSQGRVWLVDFDQASLGHRRGAWTKNFFGFGKPKNCCGVSMMSFVKSLVSGAVPTPARHLAGSWRARRRRSQHRRALPRIAPDAAPPLHALRQAWEMAQDSDANAPGHYLAYYALDVDGYHFPGERPWQDRWDQFRQLTDFRGKRVLELGCNLSLLSCYLLRQAGAQQCLAVDHDAEILQSAQIVAEALQAQPAYQQVDFNVARDWEVELSNFRPDVVFALSVLNWLDDKRRFVDFLGRFDEVIFEGHDPVDVEVERFRRVGFDQIRVQTSRDRHRAVLHCKKAA